MDSNQANANSNLDLIIYGNMGSNFRNNIQHLDHCPTNTAFQDLNVLLQIIIQRILQFFLMEKGNHYSTKRARD